MFCLYNCRSLFKIITFNNTQHDFRLIFLPSNDGFWIYTFACTFLIWLFFTNIASIHQQSLHHIISTYRFKLLWIFLVWGFISMKKISSKWKMKMKTSSSFVLYCVWSFERSEIQLQLHYKYNTDLLLINAWISNILLSVVVAVIDFTDRFLSLKFFSPQEYARCFWWGLVRLFDIIINVKWLLYFKC